MILAMVAVLAMAGTTLAEPIVTVSGPVPGVLVPGYNIYTLSVVNAEGYLGFISTDGVVQANQFAQWVPPEYSEDWITIPTVFELLGPPLPAEIDTHLLFFKTDGIYVGDGETETNDESLSARNEVFGYSIGIGSFTMGGGIGFAPVLAPGTDFMQVVLVPGTSATITGYVAGVPSDVLWSVDVPEPSTIMMLIAGGLCLLAVRFRKVPWARK